MKILAEDGTEHASVEACLAHEATLPYLKLFNDIEHAVKTNDAFAARIEALGTKLARDRLARGESRRPGRKAKGDPLQSNGTRPVPAGEGQASEIEGEAA